MGDSVQYTIPTDSQWSAYSWFTPSLPSNMSKKEIVSQLQTIVRVVGPNALALSVHVKPNAKKAGIAWEEEQLSIKLNSPPVDNKANKEVCDVIAKMVDVPKGQVVSDCHRDA